MVGAIHESPLLRNFLRGEAPASNEIREDMKTFFSQFNSCVVALSGGADSAAVLKLAVDFMGRENVRAATCTNPHIFNYEIEIESGIYL